MRGPLKDRARFSPAQCRAGRGLLGWSPERLAQSGSVEPEAVELYEAGEGDLANHNLALIGEAFIQRGVKALAANKDGEGRALLLAAGAVRPAGAS